MQYQVLPPFIFGFLLTVFPRWMSWPPLSPWHYVPVGVGLFGGQVLTLAGCAGPVRCCTPACCADAGRLAGRHWSLLLRMRLARPRQQPGTRCRARRRWARPGRLRAVRTFLHVTTRG